jgi:hypothetical protein
MPNYDEKTKAAFERIEQGVKDVYQSDNFKQYLKALSKFHNYSLNNTILILSQKPDASLVAGYNSWRDNFSRNVNRGEKAIQILAPYTVKINIDDLNNPDILQRPNIEVDNEKQTVKITRFRPVPVFDISQTDGKPLPSIVHDLQGSSGEIKAIIDSVQSICDIPIEFKDAISDPTLSNGAKGYYNRETDNIVVNSELEDLQKCKTLIHEYAHSILHKQSDKDASQREIEAESLAFVISDYFGIDTSEYSSGYIATYADGDIDKMKAILNEIQSTAHEIIEKIEPVFKEKLLEYKDEIPVKIDYDLAKYNYDSLIRLAKPLLEGDAYYMKFTTPGYMDLVMEDIGNGKIAMSHYYEQNGDLMADPDMTFIVDKDNKYLIGDSFQQDNLSYYEEANDNPIVINDFNTFTSDWLRNIKEAKYKVEQIYTNDKQYYMPLNPEELKQYCKDNGISNMFRKEEKEKTNEKIH